MQRLSKTLSMLAFALVFMAGTALAQSNDASVSQTGNDLTATVDQSGNDGDVDVDQAGDFLEADVEQGGLLNETKVVQSGGRVNFPSQVTVDQFGDENEVFINQGGDGNIATAFQEAGTSNNLIQISTETLGTTQTGFSNRAAAEQIGGTESSEIFIDQRGDGNNTFDSESAASALQDGEMGSTINILERRAGTFSTTDVVQRNGESNTATVDVFGGNDAVDILQDNVTNSLVEVTQSALGQNDMGGHYGKVTQMNGDMNQAFLTQTGLNHSSTIMQDGSNNTATVTQSGN